MLPIYEDPVRAREDRVSFLASHFAPYLKGELLDVGCGDAFLRHRVTDATYTGVDIAGDPDLTLDLEKAGRLPFDDMTYDCVVCTDVLEHLDNLHSMFDELVRVSRRYLLVSLPNCWHVARVPIAKGRRGMTHYGLPLQRPADRHKWFFSAAEAIAFLEGKSREKGLTIAECCVTDKKRPVVLKWLRRLCYPGMRYVNRYTNTVWALFEKPPPPGDG